MTNIERYANQVRSAEAGEDFDKELTILRDWVLARRLEVETGLAGPVAVGEPKTQACEDAVPGAILDAFTKFGFAW